MEKMQDLKDLLKHEIQDLYSAETQLIEALPKMAENATNPELKKALQQHLRVTEIQKTASIKSRSFLVRMGERKARKNQVYYQDYSAVPKAGRNVLAWKP